MIIKFSVHASSRLRNEGRIIHHGPLHMDKESVDVEINYHRRKDRAEWHILKIIMLYVLRPSSKSALSPRISDSDQCMDDRIKTSQSE